MMSEWASAKKRECNPPASQVRVKQANVAAVLLRRVTGSLAPSSFGTPFGLWAVAYLVLHANPKQRSQGRGPQIRDHGLLDAGFLSCFPAC